jgi:hypothetical protein
VKEKLRFDPEIMKQLFEQTTDSIIVHVKDMLVKINRQWGSYWHYLNGGGIFRISIFILKSKIRISQAERDLPE